MTRSNFWTGFLLVVLVVASGCESKMNEAATGGDDEMATAAETSVNDETMQAVELLQTNDDHFTAMIVGLTPEQLAFQESPERWSVAGVAEHLIKTEVAMQGLIAATLAGEPVEMRPDSAASDETITAMLADRTTKYQAPDAMQPEGSYQTADEILDAWSAARATTIQSLKSFDGDLRMHFGMNPALGNLDGYQWILFLTSHAERHLAQMQQVKDDTSYPAI